MGVYDVQPDRPPSPDQTVEADGAADARIAEEFRRDFMEALTQRQRRKKPAGNSVKKPKRTEPILKGPKLGGSRNNRAEVRDHLLQEQLRKR